MYVGWDINFVMDDFENGIVIKFNIFGIGFERGFKMIVGCLYKGKLWEMNLEIIDYWVKWCDFVLNKINDLNINIKDILNNVIRLEKIENCWFDGLFYVDWFELIYIELEYKVILLINGVIYKLIDFWLDCFICIMDCILWILIFIGDEFGVERLVGYVDVIFGVDGYKIECKDFKIVYGKECNFFDYFEDYFIKILK